ncbi:MAG: DUF3883 domain-containing protein [Candidatus Rokubacteria bacterium]|nr:DUF3883 domain-containing protein [Candidatus Rokubacteria bacterium]
MIPTNRQDVLDTALEILEDFGTSTGVRGRFVALYLGLRRMGDQIAPLGAGASTAAGDIEEFLDGMYTKSNRAAPFVVLTAPFGGSTSPTAPYGVRSGVTAPGRRYPRNTWRNNFAIQKGIGCPAEAGTIQTLLDNPAGRLACPHMHEDPEGRHVCTIANTNYRGEEHSIWLRMTADGYQRVNLDHPAVTRGYLNPSGRRVPIFPLIAVLYCLAPAGVYPPRAVVGIPDFAADFHFTLDQVQDLFDCDPASPQNAALLVHIDAPAWAPPAAPAPAAPPAPAAVPPVAPPPEIRAAPLPLPTPASQINTGIAAELAVAQDLINNGWEVAYRGNQPFGYDLEARRSDQVLRVEVKSSVSFTYPELRASEWEAAQRHGEECVLAVVDFVGSERQSIWYVRNPAAAATPIERTEVVYRLLRPDLFALKTEAEFL